MNTDETIAALARQVTDLLEQRGRAWEALEAAVTHRGAEGFWCGLDGDRTWGVGSRAYAAGQRVAAVLREVRGEKGEEK